MRWIAASLLLGLSSPDDGEALKRFDRLRQTIREAKTIHLDFQASMSRGGAVFMTVDASMKVKGADRWSMDLAVGQPNGVADSKEFVVMFDGRRVHATGATARTRVDTLEGASMGRLIRESAGTAMFFPVMLSQNNAPPGALNQGPEVSEVRDGGEDRVNGRRVRVIEYTLKFPWNRSQPLKAKLRIDPEGKTIIGREIDLDRIVWKETYKTFQLNSELPDSDFTYQSKRRLARAQVRLLSASASLFARYTGRHPGTLEDLVRKPSLVEKNVVWPDGGFLLGKGVPKDPWGRPFQLHRQDGTLSVLCLGADGRKGGANDDEDFKTALVPASRQPIGAPNDRLNKQYQARAQIRLLAAAVAAFRESYGELPRRKAVLWERPEWATVWPDGGWLPGEGMPRDPWGDPYRLISDKHFVRVQVQDPRVRILSLRRLTDAERKGLEEAARPRLSDAERAELRQLVSDLGDESPIRRDEAHAQLMEWGFPVLPLLDERAKEEKDPEVIGRLKMLRGAIRAPVPAWRTELAALARTVRSDGEESESVARNARIASTTLKTFASAQADFRANDRDGNRVNDFWTGDVAGLYCLTNAITRGNKDDPIQLIELSAAAADAAPLKDGAAGGEYRGIETFAVQEPRGGYFFKAMDRDASVTPPVEYRQDTGGKPNLGKLYHTHKFGICAYPEDYGVSGVRTYIISESNTVYWKDTEGEPVTAWPTHEELKQEWSKLD